MNVRPLNQAHITCDISHRVKGSTVWQDGGQSQLPCLYMISLFGRMPAIGETLIDEYEEFNLETCYIRVK